MAQKFNLFDGNVIVRGQKCLNICELMTGVTRI